MAITVVHLVRHGEVHNPEGVLYGRLPNFHLSDRGHEMAQRAADHFADNIDDVRTIISSPLLRAQETAQPFVDHYGLELRTDDRIIEAGNDFEGTVVAEHLRRPSTWPKLLNPGKPSWGEPFADIARRMIVAVRAARAEAEGGHAILISHQLPIWSTYLSASGASFLHDPRKRRCGLCSVTSFHFVDDTLTGTTYYEPAASLYTPEQETPR